MTDDDPRPPSARLPPLVFGCIREPVFPRSWDDAPPPADWLVGGGDIIIIDDPPPRGGPMTDDIDIDRLTPGTLVGLLAGDYPQGKALYVRDDGDAAKVVRVHVTSLRERVPWEAITSPPPRWAGHDDPSPMGRLRDARTAYLAARAAEQAADLALAEAVRDHVRAAVPAASWRVADGTDRAQTFAPVRPDAVRRGVVWVGVRGASDGTLQWRASLGWGDWDTPNITTDPLPDPAAALRELLWVLRAKARRVRRADRRAELGVAATVLAGWLDSNNREETP